MRVDHRLGDTDQLFGRFSTFDADELQPFGTSALQESLVPGFGRSLTTTTRNLVGQPHARLRRFDAERGALRLDDGRRRPGEPQSRRSTSRASVGLLGVTSDPRDVGFPQISTGGLYSTMGDPTVFTTRDNRHFELYDNVTIDRGSASLEVRRLLLPPAAAARTARQRARRVHLHRPVHRQRVRRLPARLPDVGRRRASAAATRTAAPTGCTLYAQDDWRVRDNLTLNLGLRYEYNQHMYDVEQPAVVDRPVDAGRPVRDRQRRQRHDRSERAGAAAADPDSVRDLEPGRAGAAGCSIRAPSGWRPAPASR